MATDIQEYLDAANEAESPEQEVAELQDMVRIAYGLLSPAKKKDMLADPDTMMAYESALFEEDLSPAADIEVLIAAAKSHGEDSEADMEPGDLQIFLRSAHGMLDAQQTAAFEADERVKSVLERTAPAPKR